MDALMNLSVSFSTRWLTRGWVRKRLVRDGVVIRCFQTWSIFNATWLPHASRMMFWHHHFHRLAAVVGFNVKVLSWRFWNWLSCYFQNFLRSHFQSVLARYGAWSWRQVWDPMIMPDGWWHPRLCWVIWVWLVHHGFIKWKTYTRISFASWALFVSYILFLFFLIGPIVLLAFLLLLSLLISRFSSVIWDFRFWKSILALSKLVLCFTHFFICISISLFALRASLTFDRLSWEALGIRFYLQGCFFNFL